MVDEKRDCGFMAVHEYAVEQEVGYAAERRRLERAAPLLRSAAPPITQPVKIPVVVHVLHGTPAQNISDEVVQAQIASLTNDFRAVNPDVDRVPTPFKPLVADSLVEFQLATRDPYGRPTNGITRTATVARRFPLATPPSSRLRSTYIEREVKTAGLGVPGWPREHYLNVWVCEMGKRPLGFAAFPGSAAWRDGVVIDRRAFGVGGSATPPFDQGRTLTHEVGHWLDLLHIWGDDSGACSLSDNVGDTPNQGGPNDGAPSFPRISCDNGPHGDLFMNYMDYVNDAAMMMFTHGQVARMHAALSGPRATILRSPGLDAPEQNRVGGTLGLVAKTASVDIAAPVSHVFDGVGWVGVDD